MKSADIHGRLAVNRNSAPVIRNYFAMNQSAVPALRREAQPRSPAVNIALFYTWPAGRV